MLEIEFFFVSKSQRIVKCPILFYCSQFKHNLYYQSQSPIDNFSLKYIIQNIDLNAKWIEF
jgi:hypothetical protein